MISPDASQLERDAAVHQRSDDQQPLTRLQVERDADREVAVDIQLLFEHDFEQYRMPPRNQQRSAGIFIAGEMWIRLPPADTIVTW